MIDFLVIGGGVAGLGTAAHLAPLGDVVLLEREDTLGFHASGRSAAMFEENYGPAPIVELSKLSRGYLQDLGCLSPRGFMLVASSSQREQFATDLETLALTPISRHDALERVPLLDPGFLDQAAFNPEAQDLDTDLLMQLWRRALRASSNDLPGIEHATTPTARGGVIHCRAEVIGITRLPNGWSVQSPVGEFTARVLINAAGAWADQIAALAGVEPLGITPKRRSIAQLPAPEGADVTGWPMILGAGETWYAKPQSGKLLVSPADADPIAPQDAWADDMVLAEGIAKFERAFKFEVRRVETSWAGLRSFSPDGVPVLGPDPHDSGFIWCAGQGGYGFQTAPASSAFIRDLVAGTNPALDPTPLSPKRFT